MKIEPAMTTLTSARPVDQARSALITALGELGAKVDGTDGNIDSTSGRRAGVRMIPWPLMPDSWLPVNHAVTLQPSESGTTIEIVVTQAYGKGLTGVGVKDRYERVLREHLAKLASAIS